MKSLHDTCSLWFELGGVLVVTQSANDKSGFEQVKFETFWDHFELNLTPTKYEKVRSQNYFQK